MKQWQQAFLKEICNEDINIKETDFEQVYEFMLRQFPYNKRVALKNFASLVRQSFYEEDFKKGTNYELLRKKAQICVKEVKPNFIAAFEIGVEYITAYTEMMEAQSIFQEKNDKFFTLENAWNKNNDKSLPVKKVLKENSYDTIRNENQSEDAKKLQLEHLGLNQASYNRLKRANIHNIYQLCCLSDKEIQSLKGIGAKNYECIKQCLYIKGYTIGMFAR